MLAAHRERFDRVVVKAPAKLKTLYDLAQDRVAKQLDKTIRAGRGATFTAHVQRILLGQIRTGQAMVVKQLVDGSTELGETAQIEALRGVVKDISKMEEHFTGTSPVLPIEEAARFYGVIDKNQTSLVRRFAGVPGKPGLYTRYGEIVIGKMETELATGMMTGKPPSMITEAIREIADVEFWRAERICRTELSWASNAANVDGMKAAAEEIPGMMHRWTENVDDATGQPMDQKVAVDSLACHGQVAALDGSKFVMPANSLVPDAKGNTEVPESLVGLQWEFPPNRPNDRGQTLPWRRAWGIPGWRYVGGERIYL